MPSDPLTSDEPEISILTFDLKSTFCFLPFVYRSIIRIVCVSAYVHVRIYAYMYVYICIYVYIDTHMAFTYLGHRWFEDSC